MLFNEYKGFVAEKEKAAWAEVDLRAVKNSFSESPRNIKAGEISGEKSSFGKLIIDPP